MSAAEYNPLVVEHFERPRNAGRFPPGPEVIEGSAGSAEQGAAFVLSARCAQQRIAAVRFEAYGCPHCIAAGSWLSELLVGTELADLEGWSWQQAAEALDMPPEKRGRLLILEDAVRALARDWRRRS